MAKSYHPAHYCWRLIINNPCGWSIAKQAIWDTMASVWYLELVSSHHLVQTSLEKPQSIKRTNFIGRVPESRTKDIQVGSKGGVSDRICSFDGKERIVIEIKDCSILPIYWWQWYHKSWWTIIPSRYWVGYQTSNSSTIRTSYNAVVDDAEMSFGQLPSKCWEYATCGTAKVLDI